MRQGEIDLERYVGFCPVDKDHRLDWREPKGRNKSHMIRQSMVKAVQGEKN